MKKGTLLVLLIILPLMATISQVKTFKFGHINSQELLQKMPEMETALSTLEDMQTNNNERLKLLQTELQNLNTKYAGESQTLDALTRQSREKELQTMNQNIQQFYQSAQQEMQQKQQQLTQPVIEKARKAVETVGKENGFTYIFDVSKGEVLYLGSQSVDVMPLVLKKLGIDGDTGN